MYIDSTLTLARFHAVTFSRYNIEYHIARIISFFFFSPNRSLNVSIQSGKSRTVRYSNIEQHIHHEISLTATVLEQLTLNDKR